MQRVNVKHIQKVEMVDPVTHEKTIKEKDPAGMKIRSIGIDQENNCMEILYDKSQEERFILAHCYDIPKEDPENPLLSKEGNFVILDDKIWKEYSKDLKWKPNGIFFSKFPEHEYDLVVAPENQLVMELFPPLNFLHPKVATILPADELPPNIEDYYTFGPFLARIVSIGKDIQEKNFYQIGQWCLLKDQTRDLVIINRKRLFIVRESHIATLLNTYTNFFIY